MSWIRHQQPEPWIRPQLPEPVEIPYEDEADLIHTPEHPFCGDPTCWCKDDPILIEELRKHVISGELTFGRGTDN